MLRQVSNERVDCISAPARGEFNEVDADGPTTGSIVLGIRRRQTCFMQLASKNIVSRSSSGFAQGQQLGGHRDYMPRPGAAVPDQAG